MRDLPGAEKYLREGPMASYAQHGHGLWLVELKATGEPVGINGLIKRPILPEADIGFAFLTRHTGRSYGFESSVAVLRHGREALNLPAIVAITAPENPASIGLLEKLGFRFDRMIDLPGYATSSRLFVLPPSPDFSGCRPTRLTLDSNRGCRSRLSHQTPRL
ncbi:MAG: GNAT family N-acetyltransferase [Lacunisphaera sp.]